MVEEALDKMMAAAENMPADNLLIDHRGESSEFVNDPSCLITPFGQAPPIAFPG